MQDQDRPAAIADVHALALAMPYVTTPHFDGHPSVLIRARNLPDLSYQELSEVIQDAWLSRASARRAADWLRSRTAS